MYDVCMAPWKQAVPFGGRDTCAKPAKPCLSKSSSSHRRAVETGTRKRSEILTKTKHTSLAQTVTSTHTRTHEHRAPVSTGGFCFPLFKGTSMSTKSYFLFWPSMTICDFYTGMHHSRLRVELLTDRCGLSYNLLAVNSTFQLLGFL